MEPRRATVRSLASDARLPVREALVALREAGFEVSHPTAKLEGGDLRRARQALGLAPRPRPPVEPARRLSVDELVVQLLRPLRTKGKIGRTHTTPIENTYGRGIPDHQKEEARLLVEELLREESLEEKVSQGRRHVWLTNAGLARLAGAELRSEGDGAALSPRP